ncbi:hypothetical protein STEG23_007114, partial [Scotinomys teguina]
EFQLFATVNTAANTEVQISLQSDVEISDTSPTDGRKQFGEHDVHIPKRDPMAGSYGVMGDDGSIDYTVHEAWNEATNVYLIVILVSFGLFMYAKRNKRKIMRIFSVPPSEETLSEPNFYDTMSKIRLRQQVEMHSA